MLHDRKMFTPQISSTIFDSLLKELHLDSKTHCFRIGGQKTANISDTHIQMLGRCKSNAYKLYFQTPSQA